MEPITVIFLVLSLWPLVAPDKPANCYVNEHVIIKDESGSMKNVELSTPVVCADIDVVEGK